MAANRPAVFFDRDGTLIHEVHYCSSPEQVRVVEGAVEALQRLSAGGYVLLMVTNQSGIGRGYFTHDDYERVHAEVVRQLAPAVIAATYYDDSTPDDPSDRRKPSPRMIEEAREELGLDLSRSWMVGDKTSDVNCGKNAGLRTVLVETGHGADHRECGADAVVPDVVQAADFILQEASCPA